MQNLGHILRRLLNWADDYKSLFIICSGMGGLVVLMTFISTNVWPGAIPLVGKLASLSSLLLISLIEYAETVQWLLLIIMFMSMFVYYRSLSKRIANLEVLLDKSASADLANWDYRGAWSSDGEILDVTNSDDGGLSKCGAGWENYDFNFKFKMMNQCAGWIVRAHGHYQYVMIQCNQNGIRPHIRRPPEQADPERGFAVINEVSHGLSLTGWNLVRTEVRGYGIRVFVNERMVFQDPDLLSGFPVGRVGFRCSGAERAQFRNVEVIQRPSCGT